MKPNLLILVMLSFVILFQNNAIAQCTTNDATDCECLDSNEVDCDLLPDITLSWYGLENVSESLGTLSGSAQIASDVSGVRECVREI